MLASELYVSPDRSMRGPLKTFLCIFGIAIFVALLVVYSPKKSNVGSVSAEADLTSYYRWLKEGVPQDLGAFVCDEPIPIGTVLGDTLTLLDAIYENYQDAHDYVRSASELLKGQTAELYQNQESVCDFSLCRPQVTDRGPDFTFELDTWVKSYELGGHAPMCNIEECAGEPCPTLDEVIEGLQNWKGGIETAHQNIKDLFDPAKSGLVITEDIAEDPSELGQPITLFDKVRREATSTNLWLTPSVTRKLSCAMTEREWTAWEKDKKIPRRFPMRCEEAIEEGVYWPAAWSEACQKECSGEIPPSDACKDCLGRTEPGKSASFLAKINFKIYNICKDACKLGLTTDCEACLCVDYEADPQLYPGGRILSKEECRASICGGHLNNWVCCHTAGSLLKEGISAPAPALPPPPPPVLTDCQKDWTTCLATISNPQEQISDASPQILDLLACLTAKMPIHQQKTADSCSAACSWFVTSISDSHGFNACAGDKWPKQCPPGGGANCCYHTELSCHYGGACKDKSYAVDVSTPSAIWGTLIQTAWDCGADFVKDEGSHIHISVNNAACGCH